MAHPYAHKQEVHSGRKMAHHRMKEYAKGGKVHHGDEKEDRSLFKKMMKEHEKGEYNVGGKVSTPRADKFARGGHAKHGKHPKGTHINIVNVAPHKPDMAAGMPPPDAGMPPPGMPPQAPMAPPPGMAPGMPAPGGPPTGMPPMKRGGAAYAKGGKVPMKAGAGTGEGRKEKIAAYGLKPSKKTSEE